MFLVSLPTDRNPKTGILCFNSLSPICFSSYSKNAEITEDPQMLKCSVAPYSKLEETGRLVTCQLLNGRDYSRVIS